jgi:hypothetical protein
VKGAAVTGVQVIGADMASAVAAPGLSNALDVRVTAATVPVSNALDATSRERCRWTQEPGAPPGAHPHRNARGPVDPALSILGGAKMSTQ